MAESSQIREGFLCPICHKDLRSPNLLIAHFQDRHSEEQDILKSIKDLYGKAKKKILKLDEQEFELFKTEIREDELCVKFNEPQDPGHVRSHTDYFKAARRERLDHRTTETNKLIIRLDRLLRFYGSDRKQQEQELVTWLDGSTVNRCPSCAVSFNITRRQHHCRLCGSIMCKSCSYFLPYDIAQTIIAPVHNLDVNGREQGSVRESDSLRICVHCLEMLESRRKLQIEQMIQPIICQLYSHLQKLKNQIQTSVDLYQKMYNSLMSGEATFQLQDAQCLRSTIAKQAETMDTLSKKIASLPVEETTPKVGVLQKNIRQTTANYIKDCLLTLPMPPTPQELDKIKTDRLLVLRKTDDTDLAPRQSIKKVTVKTGWSPANVTADLATDEISEDDPLLEQINIVRNYIDQARIAQRFEEVVSLQENLKMLKATYKEKQRQAS